MTKKKEKPEEEVSVDDEKEAAELAELRAAKEADMVIE